MKKLLCILFVGMLLLSGCAEEQELTSVCRYETEVLTEEMTLVSKGDTVLSSKSIITIPFVLYGIETEEDKALFAEMMIGSFNYEGITAISNAEGENLVIELAIDYETVDFNSLVELGMMTEEDAATNLISLEKTKAGLASSGYVCE